MEQLVNTHELSEGDVIMNHGMRIRLGERHEVQRDGRTVVWFPGTVTNHNDVTDRDGQAVWPLTGLLKTSGPDAWQWTVQGNELATWHRVGA
jgi:hypothetical protein